MKITKIISIEASADKVWQIFAHDFNNASEWMSSVPHSTGKNLGQLFDGAKSSGRVCELDANPDGIKASEKFLAYDENKKTCSVEIDIVNAPAIVPIYGNVLAFSVKTNGTEKSEVTWEVTPKLKPWSSPISLLVKFVLGLFFSQILEEFKYFAENGEPHPRKLKAISKMKPALNV